MADAQRGSGVTASDMNNTPPPPPPPPPSREGDTDNNANTDESNHETIEVRVRRMTGSEFSVTCRRNERVNTLMQKIEHEVGVRVGRQRLIYCGRLMAPGELMSTYGITDGSTLHLVEQRSQPRDTNSFEPSTRTATATATATAAAAASESRNTNAATPSVTVNTGGEGTTRATITTATVPLNVNAPAEMLAANLANTIGNSMLRQQQNILQQAAQQTQALHRATQMDAQRRQQNAAGAGAVRANATSGANGAVQHDSASSISRYITVLLRHVARTGVLMSDPLSFRDAAPFNTGSDNTQPTDTQANTAASGAGTAEAAPASTPAPAPAPASTDGNGTNGSTSAPASAASSAGAAGSTTQTAGTTSTNTAAASTRTVGLPEVRHFGVSCDVCGCYPIVGPRFKSVSDPDYDLCSRCVAQRGAQMRGPFTRLELPLPIPNTTLPIPQTTSRSLTSGQPPSDNRQLAEFLRRAQPVISDLALPAIDSAHRALATASRAPVADPRRPHLQAEALRAASEVHAAGALMLELARVLADVQLTRGGANRAQPQPELRGVAALRGNALRMPASYIAPSGVQASMNLPGSQGRGTPILFSRRSATSQQRQGQSNKKTLG